jgi:hypothetical protein
MQLYYMSHWIKIQRTVVGLKFKVKILSSSGKIEKITIKHISSMEYCGKVSLHLKISLNFKFRICINCMHWILIGGLM